MTGISPYSQSPYPYARQAAYTKPAPDAPAFTGAAESANAAFGSPGEAARAASGPQAASAGVAGNEISPEKQAMDRMEADMKVLEAKKTLPCETCRTRKYRDGSDDNSVSFQNAAHIDPDNAANVVLGHEYEHVKNEQLYAKQDGKKVISQNVVLHNDICPECGRVYVAGGTTSTTTSTEGSSPYSSQENPVGAMLNATA